MIKRITVTVVMVALSVACFLSLLRAQSSGGSSGPDTQTHAYVTATACAAATPVAGNETTVLTQSTINPPTKLVSNRLCYIVQNFSTTNPVAVGDAVSATQGVVLNAVPASQPTGSAGGSATICVTSVLNACGIGGSAVVGATDIRRP